MYENNIKLKGQGVYLACNKENGEVWGRQGVSAN